MDELIERLRSVLADRYRVQRELGRGGMATVYLADDLKHRRKVAIKVLDPELGESVGSGRFLREAPEGIYARRMSLSPDGRWIVGLVRGGQARLYSLTGASPREVPGWRAGELVLGWDPDGRSIYTGMVGPVPLIVWRLELDTGRRTEWARLRGPEDRAGTRTGVTMMGPDGKSYAYAYSRYLSTLYVAIGLR